MLAPAQPKVLRCHSNMKTHRTRTLSIQCRADEYEKWQGAAATIRYSLLVMLITVVYQTKGGNASFVLFAVYYSMFSAFLLIKVTYRVNIATTLRGVNLHFFPLTPITQHVIYSKSPKSKHGAASGWCGLPAIEILQNAHYLSAANSKK